ncbi:hypothetical protein [Amycolatopsis sp. WAC 04169]|uniref:hypothetical protein n=1 Tax=Amycolatopsis sp. WAC 04169 TaxID=2203197 RepID=UPI001F235931|nr:hypothetical protein [Amycolatopsis sp. WAC 04169]
MIESVELVVAALAAGAAAGAGEKAAPAEVMELVESDAITQAGDGSGSVGRRELAAALTAAGAEDDEELVAAALKVLELTDPDGAHAGKYRVLLHGNKGVQVGDHNTQTNTFH